MMKRVIYKHNAKLKIILMVVDMKDNQYPIREMVLKEFLIIEGRGIYYYSNGDVYIGDWKEDKFDGTGTYLF